jgi:hypothetical protein
MDSITRTKVIGDRDKGHKFKDQKYTKISFNALVELPKLRKMLVAVL